MISMKRGSWLSPTLSRSIPGWIGTTAATGLPFRVSTQVSLRGRRPYSASVASVISTITTLGEGMLSTA